MIDAILRVAAAFVDDNATTSAWDSHQRLSDEQRFAKAKKVKGVAAELRALADAAEVRRVHYAEYGELKDRLYAVGLRLEAGLDQDVAAAFREAQGPVPQRGKGWLRPS